MGKLWNWFVRKASIRKKLIISYSVLVLIPLLILGINSFSIANKNLVNQTKEAMGSNLSRLVSEVDSSFQRETDFTKYLAYNLEFRETLESNAYDNSAIAQSLNKTVEPVFWYFITSDENIKAIKIVTPYATANIGSFLETSQNYLDAEWYQEHRSNFNTEWSVEDQRLYATRTILDTATTSRMIGVLRTEFYLNRMMEPFDTMDFLNNGIMIKDDSGQIIYTKGIENEELQREIETDILENPKVDYVENQKYILMSSQLLDVGWQIYYFVDREMILEQTYSIVRSTLLIVTVCIALIFIVISILSKAISARILQLKSQAERIADGDLENPCATGDTDEIGVVTNSLGKMTIRLNNMINQVYKIEIEKKASELKALQAQMNPHFLYNCLSTIKWKALRKGDDDISDITGLIATFYRTALNNGQQITTVGNELENIKSYIEIQKKMHDDSFVVESRIADMGLDCQMPNFLLQPLVENAIKHGIDYMEENTEGIIIIEFLKREGMLEFNIYNNGPLIESEQIENLIHEQGKGYGIHNIKERLELYYGENGHITASIVENQYTCFSIKIPDEIEANQTL